MAWRALVLSVLTVIFVAGPEGLAETVTLARTPDGGIQPQALLDAQGVLHLIYYKGAPAQGDFFYVCQQPGRPRFSNPIRVNSVPGSAVAMGNIRGAQMALGRNGRIHVAWNGHAPPNGNFKEAPMLYARLNDAGTAFEPQRDVITAARGLDGGGSVAADDRGNVYVCWHAPTPGGGDDEANGSVFVAHSTDDGRTFAPEKSACARATGACGCCGMKSLVDSAGDIFLLYRSASEMVNRNETLLLSRDQGRSFETIYSHGWKVGTCPMSSAFLSQTGTDVLAAAETHGRVYFVRVDTKTGRASQPVSPSVNAKYPVAVGNSRGETLLVWTEGMTWGQPGAVAWQIYDASGNPTSEQGRADGVPAWSLVAAVVKPDGRFEIFY